MEYLIRCGSKVSATGPRNITEGFRCNVLFKGNDWKGAVSAAPSRSINIGSKNRSACDRTPAYSDRVIDQNRTSALNTTIAYETDDERWAAVQARDAGADGQFVYAVRTTGVYCRPSSSARLPKRENVEFFDTAKAAEAAGYRSSRRAHGDQTSVAAERTALVARACRMIETSEIPPQLDDLAAEVAMSAFHFHRLFKAETGLTPKAYSSAYRARKLREELSSREASITNAIYDAGFNSNSRFYEAADDLLGMSARDYRAGGAGAVVRFAVGQCSLGAILVAQSQRGICAILLGDDPDRLVRDLQDQLPKAEIIGCDGEFEQLIAQVVGFIEAPSIGLHLPLDVQGTAFHSTVGVGSGYLIHCLDGGQGRNRTTDTRIFSPNLKAL